MSAFYKLIDVFDGRYCSSGVFDRRSAREFPGLSPLEPPRMCLFSQCVGVAHPSARTVHSSSLACWCKALPRPSTHPISCYPVAPLVHNRGSLSVHPYTRFHRIHPFARYIDSDVWVPSQHICWGSGVYEGTYIPFIDVTPLRDTSIVSFWSLRTSFFMSGG